MTTTLGALLISVTKPAASAATPVTWTTFLPLYVALLTAGAGLLTWMLNQRASRRERRSKTLAEGIAAVADYAEAPYRIRRRADSSGPVRASVCSTISDIQARLAFYEAWVTVEAPAIAPLFTAYVEVTRRESGSHMTAAWQETVMTEDRQVPLGNAYPCPNSDTARRALLEALAVRRWPYRLLHRLDAAKKFKGNRNRRTS